MLSSGDFLSLRRQFAGGAKSARRLGRMPASQQTKPPALNKPNHDDRPNACLLVGTPEQLDDSHLTLDGH